MTTITPAHEGLHGTLTIGTSTLVGTVEGVYDRIFDFRIDGATTSNSFAIAEADFTPDAPPLPDVPGLYTSDAKTLGATLYLLEEDGDWSIDRTGTWELADPIYVPTDLTLLAPVDETRREVLEELRKSSLGHTAAVLKRKWGLA